MSREGARPHPHVAAGPADWSLVPSLSAPEGCPSRSLGRDPGVGRRASRTHSARRSHGGGSVHAAVAETAALPAAELPAADKYKRALADTENLRQRSQKLVEEAKLYGIQNFCKDLLEVADILEKATESVPKEELKDENPHLKNLYDGLVMTEVQIQKVFKKHGLLKLNPVGAKFDPYEHEALFHAPMEGKEPGTIALVSKVGYKLHGRTLRPALVGVVKES
ncbi:grpE protein homolog 1, mitochondrial isoform X2 [Gopherus evgoodei]|uniref:grpE protein homolog 1, mitochondrial isoform X2 n=1 Tax=Gopherus evgoodei TaxID=1825980 RepID=UPI0011CF98AC|nr:grpE protein homolog 1, mitochondrial isoform X2 [Gopherus evgoodei]